MTVKELISWLADCPPDAEVMVNDMGQGGYVPIAPIFLLKEDDWIIESFVGFDARREELED